MIPDRWVDEAVRRISSHIERTPLTYDAENDLYLKWENRQVTGSFKVRGALNKVLTLEDWERERGLVTASAGNHGQGVALAARQVGAKVIVFASDHAAPTKLAAMQALGADVRLVKGNYGEAEQAGLDYASETGAVWVSPYNDGRVIAGQATLGLEILDQLGTREAHTMLVPVGGGGLISGMGVALRRARRRISLVAVQSEASPFLHAIYQNGTQEGVEELESLADGLAGTVEETSITVPLIRQYVDGFVLVSEADISKAVAYAWSRYQEVIEGSAAVVLAAALSGHVAERPAVLVISGGNIEAHVHEQVCDRWKNSSFVDTAV
jgi:threonine dehydratase